MPLILTPGHLASRAEFYHQIAQLVSAGSSLISALEHLERAPPVRSFRQPIGRILEQLNQGATFSESLRALGRWMPRFDVALLEAGEQSGRLDACCRLLAGYYEERARAARQLIQNLLYPAVLLHFAVFVLPFPQLFLTGDVAAYLRQTLGCLLPIYALVLLLIYAGQARHGETWRSVTEAVLRCVPVLGTARRALALSRLSAALGALLNAGVPIIHAWELAADASGSPALRRAVLSWRSRLEAGQTPAELVRASRAFPELFANFYHTGEISGTLDEVLRRMHELYREEGARKLQALTQWVPRLVYFVIVVLIALRIVQFWLGYFGRISSLLGP